MSGSVTDSQDELNTNDDESLSDAPQTGEESWPVGDQAEMATSDDAGTPPNTEQNYPIHAYVEKLNILLRLDGVERHGPVRDRRK